MLPRHSLGLATFGSSPALMDGVSTMGTGAMGGMTVEIIVMRRDVVSWNSMSIFLVV